jgi:hypothetical protein
VFILFQNERRAAFAQYETVAVFVERAGGRLVSVVAFAERFHRIEAAHTRFGDGSFRTAGHDDVGATHPDIVESIHQGMGRRSAG